MKLKLLNFGIVSLITCLSASLSAQEIVLNNFETGSPEITASYGAVYTNVANPLSSGLNTTANCGEVKRTTGNWYELIRFGTSFNVPANTTKYLHLLVRYTSSVSPNMSIRVDAATDNDGSVDIHPVNSYTNVGQWQDMVFEIAGGSGGINPTQILFFADASANVLNSTDSFAYIDEMVLNDSDTPAGYQANMTLNDFEPGSPNVTANYGAVYANVANPLVTNANTTANCGEIKRSSGNWYELVRFGTYFNVPANTTKYIHMKVRYTSSVMPNMSIRIDAAADNDGGTDIYPSLDYTGAGTWQDMVFEIEGGDNGLTPTQFLFFADASVNALNNTDSFAYIDEIILNDTASPEVFTTESFVRDTKIKVFPNPTAHTWNFVSTEGVVFSNIQIIDLTGKTVIDQKTGATTSANIDGSSLAKGIYFANIVYSNSQQTIKIVKD